MASHNPLIVLMHDWTTKIIDDVKVGDELMGVDFAPRCVHDIKEVEKGKRYELTTWYAAPFIIGAENMIVLSSKKDDQQTTYTTFGDFSISIMFFNNTYQFCSIDQVERFQYAPVIMDPYILGLWLADDNKQEPTITTYDANIIQSMKTFAESNGMEIETVKKTPKKHIHRFKNIDTTLPSNIFLDMLIAMNLKDNKHIPISYIKNTREIRMELLAGLLDISEWKTNSKTTYVISNQKHYLIRSINLLAKTLGFNTIHYPRCIGDNKPSIVKITGRRIDDIPMLSNKKKLAIHEKHTVMFKIKNVRSVADGPYRKLMVDGDGKYLSADFMVMVDERVRSVSMLDVELVNDEPDPKRQRTDQIEKQTTLDPDGEPIYDNWED